MREQIANPYFYLFFGYIVCALSVHWTLTGKVWVRFHGWVYRADEPKTFWWNVAMFYIIGLFLIGCCLQIVYGPELIGVRPIYVFIARFVKRIMP
jgi:hypothetical protein